MNKPDRIQEDVFSMMYGGTNNIGTKIWKRDGKG
jgi:hypothetical protein